MKRNEKIVALNSKIIPEISEVGGKGYSLIKLSSLNLTVPNGIVLTVGFFTDWINKIKNSNEYKEFYDLLQKDKNSNECPLILNKLKEWCLNNLTLGKDNKQDIEQNLKNIFPNEYNKQLYAVRSSSPEEDLSGASFAGNYETYLGIKFDSIEEYVLKSFISCLDYRVFKYKLEKGFNVSEIKIAIVIMKQINSYVSGVGFSINPINNDYDEAVINSNFGLGESVVGGIITPDEFIVNKINKKIISQKLGSKEKIVKLNDNKNETSVIEQTEEKKKELSLTKELLLQLVDNIINIEKNYKIPIDIEFGIENNILYILQARPITTYNKIPKEFQTEPNEKRQLYLDATLSVQGFDKPLSPLGITVFRVLGKYLGMKILGSYNFMNLKKSAFECIGGKMILNLSNVMTKLPKDILISHMSNINKVIPETIEKYGEKYTNETVCYEIDVSKLGMAWRLPLKRIIFCNFFSQSSKENFDYYMDEFMKDNDKYIDDNLDSNVPILDILEKIVDQFTNNFRDYILPIMYLGVVQGYSKVRTLFEEYLKDNQE